MNLKRMKAWIAMGLTISMTASMALPAYAADSQTTEYQTESIVDAAETTDETQLSPWLITEVLADTINGERYTFVEIYNNSDRELDFADYTLFYDYPTGGGFVFSKNGTASYTNGKEYTSKAYLSATGNTKLTSVKVGAGETLVVWYNNNLSTTSYTEFKNFYGLDDDVNVIRVEHAGIHQTDKRSYRIGKDSDTVLVEAYSNEFGNPIADGTNTGKLAYQFTYPTSGRKCEQMDIAAATPGAVTEGQVPSTRVTVEETTVEIGNITASGGGDMVVTAEIPYKGTAGAMAVNLTYKQTAGTGEESFSSQNTTVAMIPVGDGKTFTATIPSSELFGSSAEYFITAGYSSGNKDVSETETTALTRKAVTAEKAAPFVITEMASTSEEDGIERYDFFEIYNQSDETINLGYWKIFYYYDYPAKTASESGKVWTISDFTQTIAPGETKVIWLNAKGMTVADFNRFYGTDLEEGKDIVEINYDGLHATAPRWFRIGTTENNAFTIAAFNEESWQLTTSGNALHYAVPNDDTGVNASIPATMTTATPGVVASWQITDTTVPFAGYPDYPEDDGEAPTLEVCPTAELPVPESINEGEELQVMYEVDLLADAVGAARLEAFKNSIDESNPENHPGGNENLKKRPYLIGTEILYKLDNDTEWTVVKEKKQWRIGHYLMKIPADILFGHDSITYKVRAYTLYGYNETEEATVKINRLNDTNGEVRLNVNDGSVISGSTTITANDGADNANTTISVDGNTQETEKVFENGAYFMIKTSGVDSYFKDAVTAPYGDDSREIITILYSWCEATTSKAIRVDNKYFTYNPDTDSYDVTITVWAGSSGTPFEEIYDCVLGENHEDFSVSGLQMKLVNGKTYLPVKIEPENEKTNTSTELDAVHTIGDSTGMETHLDATFSIPAADAEAVGITLDTETLMDGEHTITATAGEKTTTANVIVDNQKPDIHPGITPDTVLYDTVLLEAESLASDANGISDVAVSLDGEVVELPNVITPNDMEAGEHTIKIAATDVAGNVAVEEVKFTTENTAPEVNDADSSAGDASAELTVKLGEETADVTFYEGKSLTEANGGVVKGESAVSKNGSVPYQLFCVNAGDVEVTDKISVKWSGTASNADAKHPLTMYARNVEENSWKAIGTADENGNIEAVFEAGSYVEDGKATILVQTVTEGSKPAVKANEAARAAAESAQSDWNGTSRPKNYDFAIAWETDTQYYAESFPYHYDNMNQWIVDNAEDWKIKYVMHTGDIVDDCDMIGEWINADHSMQILDDAGMPYGVLGGNHDVYAGAENYGNYWRYFGEDRFEGKDYYGGSYKNNLGHYDLISEGGQDFIIIYMSWDIYTNELNWMNEVLQKYSDRKAILAFHRYIGVGAGNEKLDYTGELIQNEVVAKNENVFAVLNGHYHGASLQTDAFDDDGDGVKERTVYQICTDYQSDPEGGSEYIKFLYFDFANDKIYVNSYSPYRDDYNYYDAAKMSSYAAGARATGQDIAELDVDFDTTEKTLTTASVSADVLTNKEIGSFEDVSGTVTCTWSNLEAETEYGWYVKVTNDKNGVTCTAVNTFVTDSIIPGLVARAEAAAKAAEAAQAAAEAAAEEAKAAETAAGEAATRAEDAYDAAVAAQAKAEAARQEAEAMKEAAGENKEAAEAAQAAAEAAQAEAEAAQAKAETARAAAELAETNAKTAQEKAETAQAAAEAAQAAAETAKDDAETAAERAEAAQAKAEAAKADAETARQGAENAVELAKAAAEAAEAAQAAAEAEAKLAKAAAEAAESAKKAAEETLETIKAEAAKLLEEAKQALERAEALEKQLNAVTTSNSLDSFKNLKVQMKKPTKAGSRRIKIRWTKVEGAEGYVIQYAAKANFKGKKSVTIQNGEKTSKVIKKLKSGKKYYVRIRAYKTVNGSRVYTRFSSKRAVRVK